MYKTKPLARAISLAIAASSIGVYSHASAQDSQVTEQDKQTDQKPMEEIVTTGSRIRKDTFSSSSPIDVVLTEKAAPSGVSDLGKLLQSTTVAAGAPQVTAATSTAFVQNGGQGVSTLSLRGLGANRTLTLINGRRAGPAGTRGGVSSFDLNVIPLAAIERIEILKDGASSIYGSDAVAGVVNIFTKKENGGSIDGYFMQPGQSGGKESRLSATWGREGDWGDFRLTFDYDHEAELKLGDRKYFSCTEQYIFDANGNRADVIDPRTGKPACRDLPWGQVWLYDYQGPGGNVPTSRFTLAQYDYDGDLGQYIPPIAVDPNNPDYLVTPPGWYLVNYDRQSDGVTNEDHPFQDASSMVPDIKKYTFFGDGELNIGDSMTMYTEVLLNRHRSHSNGYRQFWGYIYNESNPFGSPNPLSAGWEGAQWLSPTPITDHFDNTTTVDYQRYLVGLRGDFNANWNYDVSYQYSKSDGEYKQDIIYGDSIYDQNWLYDYGGGEYSCAGIPTSVRGVPCQDIPWLDPQFLAGNISPAMQDFLFGVDVGNTVYKQSSVEGYISGDLFQMPAGPLGIAVGAHYQTDEINDVPGEQTLADNSWGLSSAGITKGDQTTKAVFGEVNVPILTDKKGFQDLTLTASTRYTDVDTYGSGNTYKVGLNWDITDSVKLRASRGTSFRTPALFELYLADETSFVRQGNIDPCINWQSQLNAGVITQRIADNCAADTSAPDYPGGLPPDYTGGSVTATVISSGGLGLLKAETSVANTYGFVWQPAFADLSFSIDYFDIEVDDEVDQLGPQSIVHECYDSQFYPNDPLCDLFDRSGLNGGIGNVHDAYINIATQTSKGYDVSIRYSRDIGPGSLLIDTQFTKQLDRTTALFADTVRNDLGRFGNPKLVGRVWSTYDTGNWSFFWGARYTGSVSNYKDEGGPEALYRGETVYRVLDADAVWYHDLSATYYMDDQRLRIILGVNNVLDTEPPQVSTLGGVLNTAGRSAFYTQYDWLGRRYFLNLTMTFD